jgi:hypothetical protein
MDYKTTYGEMTEAGIQILSDKFQTHAPVSKSPHKTFYDLGSGIGRIVVGLAILHPEIQSRGIEIVPDRARWANDALKRIKVPTVSSRIRFIQGSFLDPSVSFRDACWIFISNMCFDEDTQTKTARKLEGELSTGSVVICSRELPFSGKFTTLESNVNIPMTWSATSTCYVYRKN